MKNNFSKWDAGGGSRSIIQGLNLFTSRNLFKSLKSILMVVALLSLSSNVWGDYTVTFNTAGSDGSNVSTKVSDYVNSSSSSYVSSISTSKAYYNGKSGVKLGASSSTGNIVLTLSTTSQVNASSISIVSATYDASKNFKCTVTYTDNTTADQTFSFGAASASISLNSAKKVKSVKFESLTASKGRGYISSFTIAAAASKKTVYLKNTMNWPSAYAYYYTGSYWDATNGSGSASGGSFKAGGEELTYDNKTGLFKVETSNTGCTYVVFTKDKQDSYTNFYNTEAIYCNNNFQYDKVVVVASQTNETKNGTKYYSDPNLAAPQYLDVAVGEGTGFFLPGEFNSWETKGNEMTLVDGTLTYTKDLTANTTYEFKVYNKGKYYGWGNTPGSYHTFTESGSKDVYDGNNNLKIQTSIAGTYTFTFNSSTNTVTVTYPAPPVTVTFKNNGVQTSTQQVPSGGTIGTLPTLAASQAPISGYTFIGWVNQTNAWSGFEAEMTQALITGNEVINANVTYDAVWAKAYDDYGLVLQSEEVTTGNYIIDGYVNPNDYAMGNTLTSNKIPGISVIEDGGWITTTNTAIIWRIIVNGSNYAFYNAAINKYLNTVSSNANLVLQNDPAWFTLTRTDDGKGNSLCDFVANSRHLEYYNGNFDTESYKYGSIYIYKQDVSNYFVTPPAQITVTWHIGNGTQTATTYDGTAFSDVDAPEVADDAIGDCVNKFMGWATTDITKDEATADDVAWADETTISNSNKDFYAVFANVEESTDYTQITSKDDLKAGGRYLIVGNSSSTYKALPVDKAEDLTTVNPSSSKISNPAAGLVWTLEGSADAWKIKSVSNSKYLQISGGSLTFANSTSLTFSVSVSSSKFTFTSSASSDNKILSYYANGNKFNAFTTANTVYVYKSSTTYSNYATSCPELKYATIEFDANGKTLADGSMPEDITNAVVGRATTLPGCSATVTGYTFAGWSTTQSGEVITEYTPADEGQTYTMYAKWTPKTVTITWNANGGSVSPTSSSYTYDGASVELPTPTTTAEQKFVGWFTAKTDGTQITEIGTTNKPAANVTYFAQWRDITWTDYLTDCGTAYNITLVDDGTKTGGNTFSTSPAGSAIGGSTVTLTATPNSCYNFTSWDVYKTGESGTKVIVDGNSFEMPEYDVTVDATFTRIDYVISYDLQEGGAPEGSEETYGNVNVGCGNTWTAPVNPVKTGHDFAGWYNGATPVTTGYEPTGNCTLTAHWTAQTYTITYKDRNDAAFSGTNYDALPKTHTYGIDTPIPDAEVDEDHNFQGWWWDAACTSNQFTGGVLTGTAVTTNVTLYAKILSKACNNQYSFHWGGSDVKENNNFLCFSLIEGTKHEIANYVIEDATDVHKYFVGYNGFFYNDKLGSANAKSFANDVKYMPFEATMGVGDRPQIGDNATGAVGTLRIYDNSDCDNLYLTFRPNGYGLMYGATGTENKIAFNEISATVWRTAPVELTADMKKTDNSFKYQVGLLKSDDDYTACGHGEAANFGSMGSYCSTWDNEGWGGPLSGYDAGRWGYFEIWIDKVNKNWLCHFTPMYRLHYDLDGGENANIHDEFRSYAQSGDDLNTTVTTEVPVRDGYTFLGWKKGANPIAADATVAINADNVVITAQWAQNFTVTYDLEGYSTSCSSSTAHYCGETGIVVCEAPDDKTGYTFMGWNTDDITGSPADYTPGATFTMPCNNVVFTAHYQAVPYTITYEGLEGATNTNPANYTIESNITFVAPGNRTGYTFTGWTENGNPITGIVAGTTGIKTITANWSLNSHSVTFDANGHGAAPTGYANVNYGALVTKPTDPADVDESGDIYSFIGWYKEAGCTNAWNFATDVMPDNNLTLYAKWSGVTYEDYRTHCCTPLPAPTGGEANVHMTTATLSWNEVTNNNGYQVSADQVNWEKVLDGTSYDLTSLTAGTPYIYYVRAIGDKDVYCEFGTAAPIKFTTKAALHITYNANGGTGDDVVSGDIEEGTLATVADNTFTAPTGMTFNGWADGEGTAYAVGDEINPLNADLTLFAQWIGATFDVTYALNGGTGGCTSTTATYNSEFPICSTIPTNGTNAFTGWSSDVEIGGKSTFQPGETFTMPASNVTLTAQWAESYTVTYVIKNVDVSGPNPAGDVYVAQGQPTTLPDFEFSCGLYNQFIGWVDAEVAKSEEKIACPNLVGKAGDSFTPTRNITLYALFGHDAENLGWVKQTTISSGKYLMANENYVMTGFNTASNTYTSNFATVESATNTGSFAVKPKNAVELEVIAQGNGSFAMKYGTDYIAATSGNNLNYQAGVSNEWTLCDGTKISDDLGTPAAGAIFTTSQTRVIYYVSTGGDRFAAYAKGNKPEAYLYKLINEGYYTTSPTCEIPTFVTVTYNQNAEGEVEMCENAELEFDEIKGYSTLKEPYTLCAAANVVRDGYVLRTWNTAANGSGREYAPGTVFTELGNNLNLYAQWDRVYTVTLHDNGTTTTKTQASEGAAIDLGSGEYAGDCDLGTTDFTWTFVGWTTNNMTLVEYPVCPEVIANPTEYIPEANVDLYAVYSRPIENTTDFAVGVSGAYIVKDYSENWYLGARTGNHAYFNNVDNSNEAIPVYFVYKDNNYSIATSDGYLEGENSTSVLFTTTANGHWNITSKDGYWSLQMPNTYTGGSHRYLVWNQSDRFNLQQSNRAVDLIPTTGTYYFSNPVCQDKFDITFEVRGGDINYGEALETDYIGLASGAEVADFPTIDMRDDLMDWTFVGWTTVDYNTQHALDDENASTEAPTSTIYRTGGANTFTMPSTNVTLYPVFTSAIKNEPMDLENGGDYYVYFTSDQPGYHDPYTDIDGQTIRVYAQQVAGNEATTAFASTTSCANAQLFHFEQHDAEAGKWDIRLRNSAGDDYITKSYLTNPNAKDNNFESQAAKPDGYWTIEQLSDGSFKAQYSVNAGTKFFMKGWVSNPTTQASATFKCYSEDCDNSENFYAVYLGSCIERTFSADPSPLSDLRLEGTVNVTSRTGVAVRAANFLTLKGIKLQAGQKVTISSDNADVYFSATKAVNMSKADKPKNPLQITVPESGSMDMPIYVHYQPKATVDGIESVTVTAVYNYNETDLTSDVKIRVRHLPEQVVIAAKVNDQWYALPANLNGATNPLVTPITVDEATMTAEAPTNCAYTLWPVKTTAMSGDRYQEVGERVRFSAANNDNKGLWASDAAGSHTTINNSAAITGIEADPANPNYEWAISTNDLHVYTLTATGTNNTSNLSVARPTSGGNQGQLVWGTYGVNVTAEVYLLPFTTFTDMQATVIEWFQDKVLVELANGALWTAMSEASAQTQSRIGSADWATAAAVDYTTYGTNMCTFNTGSLTSSYGQNLSIKTVVDVTTYQTTLVVPIIIGNNKSVTNDPFYTITPAKYNTMDVVVRDGATLTMNGTSDEQTTFNTITIEPRSKVVVNSDRNLGASLITLRGGYDEIYSEGSYTMGYDEPQLYIEGTSSATQINYEKRVNLDQMHGLTLPDTVEQNAITYLNGSSVKASGNLYIDAYNGATRAANAPKNWYYYDATDNPLYRGVGYTISAEPAVEGQKYTILRMPMATGWTKGAPGSEDESKQIDVYAYGHGDANVRDNNKGWNCVGNPYMANYGYGEADEETFGKDLFVGVLRKEMVDDKWTGKWVRNNDGVRYVTIPHDDGHGFDQVRVRDAVLKPFRHFFVQIDAEGEDLKLTFSKAGHVTAPVRKAMDKNKEIELGILLSNGETSDNCGLLIGNAFSENYEMMNDLGKEIDKALAVYTITGDYKLAFNAMNQQYAEGMIPVGYLAPKAGNYTFSFDSKRYDIDEEVEHLYLLENGMIMADLLNTDYEFETTSGTTEGRFALRVVFGKEVTTDIDGAGQVDEKPIKFIYNDKMYILMRGKIYDATGKFVKTIEK